MTTTKQIRAALDAATPGPWWDEGGVIHAKADSWTEEFHRCDHVCRVSEACDRSSADNAHLIANAPTWLAWCLDQIAARDALLRNYLSDHACHDRTRRSYRHELWCKCDMCAEARKVMEESK